MKKFFILMALMALPFAITSCGGDDDVISMRDEPIGLVRQHFFHAGRPVSPGDEVEEFHGCVSIGVSLLFANIAIKNRNRNRSGRCRIICRR